MTSESVGARAIAPPLEAVAAARGCQSAPHRLVSRHIPGRLPSPRTAGVAAVVFQLDRRGPGHCRRLCVRHARHQPLLSSPARPPRLPLPKMVGAHARRSSASAACRIPRRAGSRSTASTISMPTSSPIRTAPWSISSGATWAGCWSRTASSTGSECTSAMPGTSCAIRFYCGSSATCGVVDHPGILGGVLPRRLRRLADARRRPLTRPLQFGLSLLVWGVFVRTVVVWHITWSVNSVTHLWGYRNYETDEDSRNNVLRRAHQQRRRLAQQSPRRSALGRARPSLVGVRRHLPDDPAPRRARACPRRGPAQPRLVAQAADGRLATHDYKDDPAG